MPFDHELHNSSSFGGLCTSARFDFYFHYVMLSCLPPELPSRTKAFPPPPPQSGTFFMLGPLNAHWLLSPIFPMSPSYKGKLHMNIIYSSLFFFFLPLPDFACRFHWAMVHQRVQSDIRFPFAHVPFPRPILADHLPKTLVMILCLFFALGLSEWPLFLFVSLQNGFKFLSFHSFPR